MNRVECSTNTIHLRRNELAIRFNEHDSFAQRIFLEYDSSNTIHFEKVIGAAKMETPASSSSGLQFTTIVCLI